MQGVTLGEVGLYYANEVEDMIVQVRCCYYISSVLVLLYTVLQLLQLCYSVAAVAALLQCCRCADTTMYLSVLVLLYSAVEAVAALSDCAGVLIVQVC